MKAKRVLITGHEGYLGSVMVPVFVEAGYDVVGLDTGYFHQCTLVPPPVSVPAVRKDLRDVDVSDLEGFDAVIHLAALSNDPLGNLNPTSTDEINFKASVRLARLAKRAGVERFLFSSSCIMYGAAEAAVVTEDSPLDPKTEYAVSKVKAERAIAALAGERFSPTFLRNGTVYGVSSRMRFDTVLNNLVGSAVTSGRVVIHGDGKPWRPVVHVQDVARSFLAVLEAPVAVIHNQAFNNGSNHLNHQIGELGEIVVETVPGATLEVRAAAGADQRTYRADFGKFSRTFPQFEFRWSVRKGIEDLYENFCRIGLTRDQFESERFTRLRRLRRLLETNWLDESLRWRSGVEATR